MAEAASPCCGFIFALFVFGCIYCCIGKWMPTWIKKECFIMAKLGKDSISVRKRKEAEQEHERMVKYQAWEQRRAEKRAEQQRKQEEVFATETGLGNCPKCYSPNILKCRKSESDETAQACGLGGCCIAGCLFWPFFLLGLLLPFCRKNYNIFRCQACKYEWPA